MGSLGSFNSKLLIGASGALANLLLVMPLLLMLIDPTRSNRTPSPCRTTTMSGNPAPPWDTRYAGPDNGDRQHRCDRRRRPDQRRRRTRRRVRVEHAVQTRLLDRRQPRRQLLRQLHRHDMCVGLALHADQDLRVEARTIRPARLRRRGRRELRAERQRAHNSLPGTDSKRRPLLPCAPVIVAVHGQAGCSSLG